MAKVTIYLKSIEKKNPCAGSNCGPVFPERVVARVTNAQICDNTAPGFTVLHPLTSPHSAVRAAVSHNSRILCRSVPLYSYPINWHGSRKQKAITNFS